MLATSYPSGQNISSTRCLLSVGRWNDFFVRGAFYPGLPMDVSSLHPSARSTLTKLVVGPFRQLRVYVRTFLSRAATAARPLHPGLKNFSPVCSFQLPFVEPCDPSSRVVAAAWPEARTPPPSSYRCWARLRWWSCTTRRRCIARTKRGGWVREPAIGFTE
jgi:hypothetical protein